MYKSTQEHTVAGSSGKLRGKEADRAPAACVLAHDVTVQDRNNVCGVRHVRREECASPRGLLRATCAGGHAYMPRVPATWPPNCKSPSPAAHTSQASGTRRKQALHEQRQTAAAAQLHSATPRASCPSATRPLPSACIPSPARARACACASASLHSRCHANSPTLQPPFLVPLATTLVP